MLVFAFDRDWTIGVNPTSRRPLEWVRHLAPDAHAVYALSIIQTLAEATQFRVIVDIVGRHPPTTGTVARRETA